MLAAAASLLVVACPSFGDEDSLATSADTAESLPSVVLSPPDSGVVLPAVPQPFRAGESLRFSVQYGIIHAGSAWLEVSNATMPDGKPGFELVARAESNSFFSHFYKVRNRIESLWDKDGRFSWRYSEDRHEGKYKTKSEIRFDPARHEAVYSNGDTFPIPPNVQDALSAFYFTRFQPLPIGGSVVFDYHASRKSQPLEVRVLGRDRVDTPAGKFDCIMVEPLLRAGGIFKNKGRLVIWLTDDERRMPVLMRSKVLMGSISVVLQEIRPGSG
jgi:hypothetical protein